MKRLVLVLVCCCPMFAQNDVATAVRGVEALRSQMRDPDSLRVETVYIKPDKKADHPASLLFCYRAKNGLGGYTREMARIKNGTVYDVPDGCALLNPRRLIKIGWVDITDEYLKVAAVSAAPGDPK